MKRIFSVLLTGCLLLGSVVAAHAEGGVFDSDKPSPVLGAPVNIGIAGGRHSAQRHVADGPERFVPG